MPIPCEQELAKKAEGQVSLRGLKRGANLNALHRYALGVSEEPVKSRSSHLMLAVQGDSFIAPLESSIESIPNDAASQ